MEIVLLFLLIVKFLRNYSIYNAFENTIDTSSALLPAALGSPFQLIGRQIENPFYGLKNRFEETIMKIP